MAADTAGGTLKVFLARLYQRRFKLLLLLKHEKFASDYSVIFSKDDRIKHNGCRYHGVLNMNGAL